MTELAAFRTAVETCGLKASGRPDLVLVAADRPCVAAGLFTRNRVQAAPVLYDRQVLARNRTGIRAVLINSGIANACTGPQGLEDARTLARTVEAELGLPPDSVLVMSTGVIGPRLPVERMQAGIRRAAGRLAPGGWRAAAEGMMTTDTHPKLARARAGEATVLGLAKGAGMIHPDMATMLALILTDAALAPDRAQALLTRAVDRSFHAVSVDGDTSTNDTVLLLASGERPVAEDAFEAALTAVCQDLARQIAWDGEGATLRVTIHVRGAPDEAAARAVGRTVATSPLVKTALWGRDPNWGRIVAAAGRSGVPFDPEGVSLRWNGLLLFDGGVPVPFDPEAARASLDRGELVLELRLGDGPGEATVWTCDLSVEYVRFNGEYHT